MHIKDAPLGPDLKYASSVAQQSEEVDLQWVLRTLLRRKWAIIIPAVLAAMVAIGVSLVTSSSYDATSEVLLDPKQVQVPNLQSVITGALSDEQAVESEAQVISSRDLAYRVVDAFNLVNDPEFNDAIDPSLVRRFRSTVGVWIKSKLADAGVIKPEPELTPSEKSAAEKASVVDNVLRALTVSAVPKSRVIDITFRSKDPRLAAEVANKFAELYVLTGLDAKYEATRRATSFLSDKIAELRKSVAESERAVESFRSKAGLLQTNAGTLISQQISDLNTQLILVRTARAEAEARLSQARQLARSNGAEAAADVLKSPIIQQLIDQETQVKRKVAELSDDFGDRHPRMIAARAELADVQSKLHREIGKVLGSLESEVGVARAREATLERNLDELKGKLAIANSAEVQLSALQRDADASRTMLESFLANYQQTSAQLDPSINDTQARIISRADVPDTPAFPPKSLLVVVAFIGAAVVATLAVLGIEQMDRGFRSGEQLEKVTGLRSLGLVPVAPRSRSSKSPADFLLRHPSSMFGESIRSLYTSILLSPTATPPRKLLVSSSQPKEGKTTISLCLGRMRALAGHSTVVIEADLRRPSLHRVMGVPRRPGLAELVLGEARLADVLVKDEESGAYLIPAGKLVPDPTAILSSARMTEVFSELERQFDLIVVDTPPIVAVADTRLLASQVDAAVLVVRWAKTNRDVVGLAIKQLAEAKGQISGAVLSMVDSKKHARYGFADSAYYYGPVRRYYTG